MRAAVKVNPMDTLRQLPENKKCFDCQQKGTMYCVMNFHVFVCSSCAGIHREMTHKVKGISMCVFTDQELKDLTDNGNANMQAKLMKKWKARNDPIPEKTDNAKMKAFLQAKYVQKKFAEEVSEDSSEDSEEERARRKKKKEKKKAKAKKAAKKAASSSSEEEEQAQAKPAKKASRREEQKQEEDSDDGEEPVFKQKKTLRKRGLGAPPSSTNLAAKPQAAAQPQQVQQQAAAPAKVNKAKTVEVQPVAPVQNNDVGSLLDFGSPAPVQQQQQQVAPQNDGFDGGWDAFDSAPAQSQTQPVAPQQQQQQMMQQPVQQQQQQQPVQQQPVPQASTASLLDDVFGMAASTPVQPNAQAAPVQGGFQPNQASFKPQMMNNMAGNSPDPFGQMFQGGNPGAPQGGAPNSMNAMGGGQQMAGQPMGGQQMAGQPMGAQMAGPAGQHQNPNAMAMQQQQQQMMMMQQRMQQMSLQGGQQNPMQVQQMQQQMQMMMSQMQQMMMQGQQPGAQGMGQQMPTQGGMGMAVHGMQQPVPNQMQNMQNMQQMPMQQPAPQDSLSNLFNQVKNQPAAKPQQQQQQQSSAEYNPFDM